MSEPTPTDKYYIPASSHWPILCCVALFTFFVGIGRWLHELPSGPWVWLCGVALLVVVLFGWFGTVISENLSGVYNEQVGRSFRSGMKLLILSEIVFFAGFFGGYFFIRLWGIPMLGGEVHPITSVLLWPDFTAEWPLLTNPDAQWEDRYTYFHVGRWAKADAPGNWSNGNPDPEAARYQRFAVRSERWRYEAGDKPFDIDADPGQRTNVIDQHPQVAAQMRAAYDAWWESVRPLMVNEDAPLAPERPYHVGFEQQQQAGGIPDWQPPVLD